jgi:hypothetical protein
MMLFWRGWGILMLVLGVACLVITELGVNAAMQDAKYYEIHGWPKLLALWLAAAASWPLARLLRKIGGERIELDDPDGIDPDDPEDTSFSLHVRSLAWPETAKLYQLTDEQQEGIRQLVEAMDKYLPRLNPAAQWDETQYEKVAQLRDEFLEKVRSKLRQLLTPQQYSSWEGGTMALWIPGEHSLFFIPVQYWWIAFLVLGVAAAFLKP